MFTERSVFIRFFFGGIILSLLSGCAKKNGPSVKELILQVEKGDFTAKLLALDKLGELGSDAKPAVPTLITILGDDKSPIPGADEAVEQTTISRPEEANATLRSAAAATLGDIGPDAKAAIPALLKSLKDKDKYVRCVSADALAGIGLKEERVLSALKETLNDPLSKVRLDAADALNELDPDNPDALAALVKLLKDKDPHIRCHAVAILEQIKTANEKPIIAALVKALNDPEEDVRCKAAESLGSICEESASVVPVLVLTLKKDTSSSVRRNAIDALKEFGPEAKAAIAALTRTMMEDPDSNVRERATQAIRRINTMPAKRGRKGAEAEDAEMLKQFPEMKQNLKRRRGIKGYSIHK